MDILLLVKQESIVSRYHFVLSTCFPFYTVWQYTKLANVCPISILFHHLVYKIIYSQSNMIIYNHSDHTCFSLFSINVTWQMWRWDLNLRLINEIINIFIHWTMLNWRPIFLLVKTYLINLSKIAFVKTN